MVFLYIFIGVAVMCITCYIVLNMQLKTLENKVKLEYQEFEAAMNESECVEEDIAIMSESLNTAIRTYNVAIQVFPCSLVAKLKGLKEIPQYRMDTEK